MNFSAESDYTLLLRNQKVAFLADALVSSALVTPSRLLPHLLLRKIGNVRENFLAVFILRTHYPTGRTWANICSSTGLCVSSIKTGTRRIMRLDELFFEIRLERRTMRLVPHTRDA